MLMSRSRLIAEIEKCDIVCANCHAGRTYRWLRTREKTVHGTSRRLDGQRERWRAHAKLLEQLRDVPCADCGIRYPSHVMQFDHRDSSHKDYTVTRMIGRAGRAKSLRKWQSAISFVRTVIAINVPEAFSSRGCGVMEARDPSKVEARVRFPPPAPVTRDL